MAPLREDIAFTRSHERAREVMTGDLGLGTELETLRTTLLQKLTTLLLAPDNTVPPISFILKWHTFMPFQLLCRILLPLDIVCAPLTYTPSMAN